MNQYNRSQVVSEIQQIRVELSKLEASNDKSTAKIVDKRLQTIEEQIEQLENKYGK